TGIGIDPKTQTQDGQRLYSAEYLRLRPNVRCGFSASLRMKQNGDHTRVEDCIDRLFTATQTIIVGGQRRACRVEAADCLDRPPLPEGPTHPGNRVKWVLLSPAVWPVIKADPKKGIAAHPGGWVPNWIAPHDAYSVLKGDDIISVQGGQVLLKAEAQRGHRESREAWRERVRRADFIEARLVAVCAPKAVPITGWTERLHLLKAEAHWGQDDGAHGPRPSHLAVPAGAVYYFEAASEKAATALVNALNWHGTTAGSEIKNRRSALMGEKGFGLGVCGSWSIYPAVKPR
ncbi:MAG: type III-B CRISPR module-associated Cmr3 family protein, partial [Limisphaerales bacterium]